MTLNEAIEQEEMIADMERNLSKVRNGRELMHIQCAQHHEQMAGWLKELKRFRVGVVGVYKDLAHILDAPNDIEGKNAQGGIDIAVATLDKYFAEEDLECD